MILQMITNKHKLSLKVLEVQQHGNVFYVGKIKAKDLLRIATVHVRATDKAYEDRYINEVKKLFSIEVRESEEGIQRVLQESRLKKIADYLKQSESILPGSLIVSINNKTVTNEDEYNFKQDGYELSFIDGLENFGICDLTINTNLVDAFIVDGQHRLAAFHFAKDMIEDFELVVSIFLDMEVALQAELFSVINGTQKPVNKSLLYDLRELQDEYDEIKKCHAIVKWFHTNEKSPFKGKIKMLGMGFGTISQSAFIDELLNYVKKRKTNEFRSFMKDKDSNLIINILYSYFLALQELFPKAWEKPDEYILLKTTGFGAVMKLLYYVYISHIVKDTPFKRRHIVETMSEIKKVTDFSKDKYRGLAGQGVQSTLYKDIREKLFGDEQSIVELEGEYVDWLESQ